MKKIISIILCAVMVFAMGVTVFAATDDSQLPGYIPNNPAPNDPEPDISILWNNPSVIIDMTEDYNPNTGASAMGFAAIIALSGAAAFLGKRK